MVVRSLIAPCKHSSQLLLSESYAFENFIDKQQDAEEGSSTIRPWSTGTVDSRPRRVVSETGQNHCRARPVEANDPLLEIAFVAES